MFCALLLAPCCPAGQLRIASIERVNDCTTLTWDSQPGKFYTVLWTDRLAAPTFWRVAAANLLSAGDSTTWSECSGGQNMMAGGAQQNTANPSADPTLSPEEIDGLRKAHLAEAQQNAEYLIQLLEEATLRAQRLQKGGAAEAQANPSPPGAEGGGGGGGGGNGLLNLISDAKFYRIVTDNGANRIQTENAKPGSDPSEWGVTGCPANNHEIEGFASKTSYNKGEQIDFYINSPAPYDIKVFRMGWYGGKGARRVHQTNKAATEVKVIPPNPVPGTAGYTGLIDCLAGAGSWGPNPQHTIPAAETAQWTSGVYLAKLIRESDGLLSYILFVLRDDAAFSDYLYELSVMTYQAYNSWGGKSLYGEETPCPAEDCFCDHFDPTFDKRAFKVSFNRPIRGRGAGSSPLYDWDYNMIRWLERQGYDVTYCSSLDLHENSSFLGFQNGASGPLKHRAMLSVGHDEYWSLQMRQNVEAARERGVHLGFFSANNCFWQVRFEDNNRTMVCYKEDPSDPHINDSLATVRWRQAPVNNPEINLIGVQYVDLNCGEPSVPSSAIRIADPMPEHWIYQFASLRPGSQLLGLLGYEADGFASNPCRQSVPSARPAGTLTLARSPFRGAALYSEASIYAWPGSGALVFATGSMDWNFGLDNWIALNLQINSAVQQMTHNVLSAFVGKPLAPVLLASTDTSTLGDWRQPQCSPNEVRIYGADGCRIANGAAPFGTLPAYAQLSIVGQTDQTWPEKASQPRALLKPCPAGDRASAAWTTTEAQNASFDIDLNITDGSRRQVALYCADWLDTGTTRQKIEVFDAADTLNPLDTRDLLLPPTGIYFVWKLSGHKILRVSKADAAAGNKAMVSGIFFDTPFRLDPNFFPFIYVNGGKVALQFNGTGTIRAVAFQPDGRILIGGDFTIENLPGRSHLVRLSSDGRLDLDFLASVNSGVYAIAVQPDEKILIGGSFTSVIGVTLPYLARLDSRGDLDGDFDPPNLNDAVYALGLQPDGKIVAGGAFTQSGATIVNRTARFLPADGALDSAFRSGTGSGFDSAVRSIALQPDGKIVVGGDFQHLFDGATTHDRNRIARLNSDGSPDLLFSPVGPAFGFNAPVHSVALQSDGRLVVGGAFTSVEGAARGRIARLNANGSLDTSFAPASGANNTVQMVALQSDDQVVLGGSFTSFNGVNGVNRIARLTVNGSLDGSFNVGSGAGAATVYSIALQTGGGSLVGGDFVGFSGFATGQKMVRLYGD